MRGIAAARVMVVGTMLAGSTGLVAPPAQAGPCGTVRDQCEALLTELRKVPLVCETVPNVHSPEPYTYEEAALCDDPDRWVYFLFQGLVQGTAARVGEIAARVGEILDRPAPGEFTSFVCRDLLDDRCQELIKS